MKIRVATYNIHKGVSYRSQPRVHALKNAIAQFDANLIFLQEVQGQHDRIAARYGEEHHGHRHWPKGGQHEFFAGESHQSVYGLNAQYDHGHHGNALLSSYPIARWTNTDVSDHAYEQRGILHSVVETPRGPIHCYVIHLGLFERSRVRQLEALIEAVNTSAGHGEPVIIAGDFNDWRNTLSAKLRKALGVAEVFDEIGAGSSLGDLVRTLARRQAAQHPAKTFPAALPFFRLDRIYVRGFKVESAQVMHGAMWAKLSDHAPIVATLDFA
ncbi:endonuclease/exonuclease/phosphatase family protein [Massilia sp. BJB1822]|uniref:endonuclease/exonuclease/phosphatase family protein n=1 Tax=Massilia sp. BJB1822 TaxID=2744470 RepID=UPI001593C988|nr:endonuclease/exonuclease/phosphatase family protein [Massilia sp. BJB1822]NVD99581.1 endonuclease/exonuclease/phosphatase family protein [Massilia sp. BJB1822]